MITQNQVMSSFNKCVDDLISQILIVTKENSHDPEMQGLKTKRLIQKWFRNAGKL